MLHRRKKGNLLIQKIIEKMPNLNDFKVEKLEQRLEMSDWSTAYMDFEIHEFDFREHQSEIVFPITDPSGSLQSPTLPPLPPPSDILFNHN